jgi:conjugal transfer pilus assembly protein TraV
MNKRPLSLLLLTGSALSLSACASLGGTVKGDFNCRAPAGTCAPMSLIDDRAVASLGTEAAPLLAGKAPSLARSRVLVSGASGLARTPDRVLRIVFPTHVDRAGVLHEAAVAHAVVERGAWVEALTGPAQPAVTSSSSSSRSIAPSSLREAIAGASAPAIEGLDVPPYDQAPHPFDPTDSAAEQMPSPAALEAARAGHRIGTSSKPKTAAPQVTPAVKATPRIAGSRPAVPGEPLQKAKDRAAAAERAAQMAKPALNALGTKPSGAKPDTKGGIFPEVPGQEEAPR